ncbi:hypothetical protein [Burkholderia ambifaria]|uniref:hypothetical protein n=1 Tax=Burkholderia ambifaria TaxID=152480 RepID=UPI00158EBC22|nr:hypothetical protein [Burkholderia ambifaria]
MTEPILTREEVLKFFDGWRCSHPGCKNWVEIPEDVLVDLLVVLQAAVLEKICGEPIYQIAFSDEDGWCDTHKKCYDEHPEHMRRIVYALTRSKP